MPTVITSYSIFIVVQTPQFIGHFFLWQCIKLQCEAVKAHTDWKGDRTQDYNKDSFDSTVEYYGKPIEIPEVKLIGKPSTFSVM